MNKIDFITTALNITTREEALRLVNVIHEFKLILLSFDKLCQSMESEDILKILTKYKERA